MTKKFILFAKQRHSQSTQWVRINSTARTTHPVTLKTAQAKADIWKKAGWDVQAINVYTQEAQQL